MWQILSGYRKSKWKHRAKKICRLAKKLQSLNDAEVHKKSRELQWKLKSGEDEYQLIQEAYALAFEATRRQLGLEFYPVQLMAGMALFAGGIAEMQTGEGKTITAVLPTYLRALAGKGCHVITVNDYLASRDAKTLSPVFQSLGLTVGCITTEMEPDDRRHAYACDVTYGTAKEMGFDFLKDRLRLGVGQGDFERKNYFSQHGHQEEPLVQRGHYFALIDEADSILIDEAKTPLIIAAAESTSPEISSLCHWCREIAFELELQSDFVYRPKERNATLTENGCRKLVLTPKPTLMNAFDMETIYGRMEKALTAQIAFEKDKHYIINDDEIVIVDESTGRMMEGRKWQEGLHQAIEVKENVTMTPATVETAKVTIQRYFQEYSHLGGMTGTALPSRKELKKTYHVSVDKIPTHHPCIRKEHPPRLFASAEAKRNAIVISVLQMLQKGRSVLIGTPSVEASEVLSLTLEAAGVDHQVLNAKLHEVEAKIVEQAGKKNAVTIATNMAGRGTDILLAENVKTNGGLHVIATEMHTAARIDRQLVGRAARQGDPGSYQFFLSTEDELLNNLPFAEQQAIIQQAFNQANNQHELSKNWMIFFRRTQRRIEKQHVKQRKQLMKREEHLFKTYQQMGLDPFLESME